MNTTVRLASLADLPIVQQLNQELFKEELHRDPSLNLEWPMSQEGKDYFQKRIEAQGTGYTCLVLEVEGMVVGYVVGSLEGPDATRPIRRAELENTLILPEWRGQGGGTLLYEAFAEWARSQGAKRVVVHAYSTNEKALGFYIKNGFAEVSKTLEQNV